VKRYPVSVQRDHVERLARARRPVSALAELIWNSLDADAKSVRVELEREIAKGITKITVTDDGLGITGLEAVEGFTKLGGSWKRLRTETKGERRALHGKEGKGRFAAFVLGSDVKWDSVADGPSAQVHLVIRGRLDDLLNFEGDEPTAVEGDLRGTTVSIVNVSEAANSLDSMAARSELTELFAFYLKKYPAVSIQFDGMLLEPEALQLSEETFDLPPIQVRDRIVADARLTVVEWAKPMPKTLHFCDDRGFTLHNAPSGLKAPGFEYSAYLLSSFVRDLYDKNEFALSELSEDIAAMQEAARARLREYFRAKKAAATASLVDEWKRLDVYPFTGEPTTTTEISERQVFDILAANVQEFAPDFATADPKTKRLSFHLLS
jgi:hypothetical protein